LQCLLDRRLWSFFEQAFDASAANRTSGYTTHPALPKHFLS
jgi:hypothetical protein